MIRRAITPPKAVRSERLTRCDGHEEANAGGTPDRRSRNEWRRVDRHPGPRSGTTNPDQTTGLTVDVFEAPYTTDPTTLSSTAKKVATFTNATRNADAIAQNGHYAWPGGFTSYIVRSDGSSTTVASDGKTYSQIAVYVSDTEDQPSRPVRPRCNRRDRLRRRGGT